MPVRDPVALGYNARTIGYWRGRLWSELGPYCFVCLHLHSRKRMADHLHEGILWRSEVQGFPFPKRLSVFSDVNSFPICSLHHQEPPPRSWFFDWACQMHGEKDVRAWYASFNWKVPPDRRFMP